MYFSHFYSISSPNRKQNIPFHPFFGHDFLCFIFYLRPHPPLIQKGGGGGGVGAHHTLHAYSYSFSYWDTPTSHQKGGGGMCLIDPPMSSLGCQIKVKLADVNIVHCIAKSLR